MISSEYKPFHIPGRERAAGGTRYSAPDRADERAEVTGGTGCFAEVDFQAPRAAGAAPAHLAAALPVITREISARFRDMRRIADYVSLFREDRARVFYEQAAFMRDFEDDYAESAPFSAYYPDYQKMGYRQLRTYFTWRAQVRRGAIHSAPVSYAFVYIYELLNNIGVEYPARGFDMLLDFWVEFRRYSPVLERYMPRWLKEYYICYGEGDSFQTLAGERGLAGYYPEAFAYGADERAFDAYADISSYDVRKSKFYGAATSGLMRDCFLFTLGRLRELCEDKGVCFEDMIFYPGAGKRIWHPFGGALVFPSPVHHDRKVVITKREAYAYRKNHWVCKDARLSDDGKRLVGYIMKATESALRRAVRFKYVITARPDCDCLRDLERLGISAGEVIKSAVAGFYADATRTRVSVDARTLGRIRRESADTLEKLLVPEDELPPASVEGDSQASSTAAGASAPDVGDAWGGFFASLTPAERDALAAALRSRDIKASAAAAGMMPEVLADGINQKAVESLGDVVMELDGADAVVYEDYRHMLEKLVGC
jgi:hypothetical protein